jgi:hypothetical protein
VLSQIFDIDPNGGGSLQFIGCSINGAPLTDTRIDRYQEDALLLCFSASLDRKIMRRLGKFCCVEIVDFERLLSAVTARFDRVLHGYVKYTAGTERSHFMKSDDDAWMQEFRIVVPEFSEQAWVEIPLGVARKVDVSR